MWEWCDHPTRLVRRHSLLDQVCPQKGCRHVWGDVLWQFGGNLVLGLKCGYPGEDDEPYRACLVAYIEPLSL